MKVYKNSERADSGGSQSEQPTVKYQQGVCNIKGYQTFTITKTTINVSSKYNAKFKYIKKFLQKYRGTCTTVADIGASNGLVSFTASQLGYTNIYALDHDRDCIQLINNVCQYLQISNIQVEEYSFGDDYIASDIVIVGALIHWIYSCTALYGNFDQISSYLRNLTNKYLLIEWVNPDDPVIHTFHHTSFNKRVIKEPYTKANFIASLQKYFNKVDKVFQVKPTRELYLCIVGE
jgi:hypothetical protein